MKVIGISGSSRANGNSEILRKLNYIGAIDIGDYSL